MNKEMEDAGLGKVGEFQGMLEDLKTKAGSAPGDAMNVVKDALESMKKLLSDAMNDPSSLAGSGSMASCASWYGNAVVGKLKDIAAEFQGLFDAIMKAIEGATEGFSGLGGGLGDAMTGIQNTLQGLQDLPKTISNLAGKVKGPADLKDVDTKSMNDSLDLSGMGGPIDALGGLKEGLGTAMDALKQAIEKVLGFLSTAPDTIKEAFGVPTPLCCMTSMVMSQAPEPMKNLLDKVESLQKMELDKKTGPLDDVMGKFNKLDFSVVKEPMEKFAEAAKGQVEKLEKAVEASKMASGAALPAAVPGAAAVKAPKMKMGKW